MKIYNLTLINAGWGKMGLKSLNSSPPHQLFGVEKTHAGHNGEGQNKITISTMKGHQCTHVTLIQESAL